MTVLTIYSNKYDKDQDVVNNGLSDKVFLDIDNQFGNSFPGLDEALEYCYNNNINIHRIDFNYQTQDGIQMFQKFKVNQ